MRIRGEWWVGLAGAGGAVALCVVALGPVGDPEQAGEAALERSVRRGHEEVALVWRRFLGGLEWPGGIPSERIRWKAGWTAPPSPAAGVDLDTVPVPQDSVVRILLEEASRLEVREGRLDDALTTIEAALSQSPDSPDVALALLRGIQLAVRLEQRAKARDFLAELDRRADVRETTAGLPVRLVATLVASPVLSEAGLQTRHRQHAVELRAGRIPHPAEPIALQVDSTGMCRFESASSWRLLLNEWRRGGAPVDVVLELEQRDRDERVAAVARLLPDLPGLGQSGSSLSESDLADSSLADLFAARRFEESVFTWRRRDGGFEDGFEGGFVPLGRFVDEFLSLIAADPGRMNGFVVRVFLDGEPESIPSLGGRRQLAQGVSYALVHPGVDDLRALGARPVERLRWMLFLVAFALLGASAATAFTLVRERRIQALKVQFVAHVSHELRTPLASIQMMVENLESGAVAGAAAHDRYYPAMRRESERLRRLVDEALDFSRLERGKQLPVHPEEIDLAAFVRDLGEEARERARSGGCELELRFAELPNEAVLDPESIRRAVLNLVENALRHARGSNIVLEIVAQSDLCFEVRDWGPGISRFRRRAVFRPFRQLDAKISAAQPGIGLGLSIVREIARQHGGKAFIRDPGDAGGGVVVGLRVPLSHAGRSMT